MRKAGSDSPIRAEATRQTLRQSATSVALAIFLPICWAALGAFNANLSGSFGNYAVVPWLALTILHVTFWFAAYPRESTVLALAVENSDLREERDTLSSDLESAGKWVFHSYAAHALRAMSIANVRNGIRTMEDLQEALNDLLAPLYLSGGDVLGFDGSERWSFTVYLYSAQEDELKPVWREKSRNHPASKFGRAWGRGQGHVGKAFVDGKIIVTGDASHLDVIQLCGAPAGMDRDYDVEVYRSFASIPIGLFEGDGLPYGVLVGTSDRKGRFDEDSGVLLWHYADSIGILSALGGADFDKLHVSLESGEDDGEKR